MGLAFGALEFAFLMSVWKVWGKAFSNVRDVVSYVSSMTLIVAVSIFIDSFQTAFQGNRDYDSLFSGVNIDQIL